MTPPPGSEGTPALERWPTGRARRAGIGVLYALLGAAAVYVLVRNMDGSGDYRNFLPFGLSALNGQLAYAEAVQAAWLPDVSEWATWPPSFAPLAALLARVDAALGTPAAVALWQAANLGGLALMLAAGVRWLHGRRLSLRPGPGRMPLYALPALAGLLVPARVVLGNFEHSQSNLLFLGLAVAAFDLFRRGRRTGGGVALGFATAFKGTPLLALPYLAWRGRWRDLGAAAGGCLLTWGVLPTLLLGPGGLVRWYRGWWEHTGTVHLPTASMNQSLQATLTRLAAPGAGAPPPPRGALLGGHGAEPWVLAGLAGLALASAAAFGRPLRSVSAPREALELGVVLTLMALVSPFAWKFHFVGMVPLAAALYARCAADADADAVADSATERGDGRSIGGAERRAVRGLLVAAFLALTGTATGVVGGDLADAFERAGVVTWTATALVLAGLWCLWRERTGKGGGAGP